MKRTKLKQRNPHARELQEAKYAPKIVPSKRRKEPQEDFFGEEY